MEKNRENVRLVVDTNIIVSALIKSLKIKRFIFGRRLSLYVPAYIFYEIRQNFFIGRSDTLYPDTEVPKGFEGDTRVLL